MMTTKNTDLLDSTAQALVNTVNTAGVMGKGVALQFRERFAGNYRQYREACERGELEVGKMLVTQTGLLSGPQFIINFPTKQHWKGKSKMQFIEEGLDDLVKVITQYNIRSIAIPPLGCGNGGLDWKEVRPLIESKLAALHDVAVELYEPGRMVSSAETKQGEEKLTKPRALVLSLIYRYCQMGFEISHLEIQKLAYFLQSFGQKDLKLRFGRGTYGPFAPNLQHLLQKMEGVYLHGDIRVADAKPMDTLLPDYGKRHTVEEFLDEQLSEEELKRLEKVEQLIDGFESPFGLELLATVYWVVEEKQNQAAVADVVNAIHNWTQRKRELMKPELIAHAYQRVQNFTA